MRMPFSPSRQMAQYATIMCGIFLSGLGSGLTQVAVYSKLSDVGGSPFLFSLAFALGVLPALFASRFSTWLVRWMDSGRIIYMTQLAGAVSILFPYLGIESGRIELLVFAEFVTAMITAMLFPHLQYLVKTSFTDETLPLAAKIDTYLFTANVVFGTVLGSILLSIIGYRSYLIIDFFTYIAAFGLVFLSRWHPQNSKSIQPDTPFKRPSFSDLSPEKKRAFMLMPLLTLVGVAPVSLLPSFGIQLGAEVSFVKFTLSSAMFLLIGKSLGQMIGPLVIPGRFLYPLSKRPSVIIAALTLFVGLYLVIPTLTNPIMMFFLVVVAHIFSNIVFIVAMYSLQRFFGKDEILDISASQYRWQMSILTFVSIGAGGLATLMNSGIVILLLSGTALAISAVLLLSLTGKEGVTHESLSA